MYSSARYRDTANGTNTIISPTSHASVPSTGPTAWPPTVSARTELTHSVMGLMSANVRTTAGIV